MYTSRDIARMFIKFCGNEEPCNFNDMDEKDEKTRCMWCLIKCGNVEPIDCWIHAIESGWLDD